MIGNKINDKTYIPLPPFKGFVLENFPFIEADFDAITNYQLLCKVIEYLNNVIANQNTVQELGSELVGYYNALVDAVNLAISEFETDVTADINQFKLDVNTEVSTFETTITTQFNNLKNYVDNFFDNLDVQDEIDNKLDEMVSDGTLSGIITSYLNTIAVFCYDTVNDLKSDSNLLVGSYAKTLGYYSINDGGGALYKITTVNTTYHQELLNNGLYASLIIENDTLNLSQLGGKPSDISNNERFDNKNYLLEYERICTANNKTYKLLIDNGYWLFSATHLTRFEGYNIEGCSSFPREPFMGSIILPYNSDQTYIWKFGGNENYSDETNLSVNNFVTQTSLNKLHFSTNINGYLNNNYKNYVITNGLLILDCCMYWDMDNIYIQRFMGNGLVVRNAWEVNIGNLMFRGQHGCTYNNILFDKKSTITGIGSNISAFDINNLMFEGSDGCLINSIPGSGFSHNHIGHINIEHYFSTSSNATNMNNSTDTSSFVGIDLIKGMMRSLVIDSINFFYDKDQYCTENNLNYYFRSLIATVIPVSSSSDDIYNSRFCLSIGVLNFRHQGHTSIVYSHECYISNLLNIANLMIFNVVPLIPFDLYNGIIPKIGVVSVNEYIFNQNDNDAYNLYSKTRTTGYDECCVLYDQNSPTLFGLVVNLHNHGDIYFKNDIGANFKIRILYKSGETQNNMVIADTVASTWHTITAPVTSGYEWIEYTYTNNTAIGNKIRLDSKDNNIARIILINSSS